MSIDWPLPPPLRGWKTSSHPLKAARPGTRDNVSRCSVALHTASQRLAEWNRSVTLRSLFMSGRRRAVAASSSVSAGFRRVCRALRSRHPCRLQPAQPTLPAATALRRPDSHVQMTKQHCITRRTVPEPEKALSLVPASVRPAPAAAYGLAPYAICVRLQPRLTPSLHPAPNSIGHLMNARFSVGSNINVITRPKDGSRCIYICSLGAVVLTHARFLM